VQKYYLFNQIPRAKRCLITKDGDKLTRLMNTDAVNEYFVKIKIKNQLDKSQT